MFSPTFYLDAFLSFGESHETVVAQGLPIWSLTLEQRRDDDAPQLTEQIEALSLSNNFQSIAPRTSWFSSTNSIIMHVRTDRARMAQMRHWILARRDRYTCMLPAASSLSPNPASGQAHGNCSAATSARAGGGGPRTHACRGSMGYHQPEIQMFPCHRSVSNNEVRRLALGLGRR